jgi:hypothetical protein
LERVDVRELDHFLVADTPQARHQFATERT